jgi:predicted AlkP superfamily pyrophosphatase or phosphodiesterase
VDFQRRNTRRRVCERMLERYGFSKEERKTFKEYRQKVQPNPTWKPLPSQKWKEGNYFSFLNVTSPTHDFEKGCPDQIFLKKSTMEKIRNVGFIHSQPIAKEKQDEVPQAIGKYHQLDLIEGDQRTYYVSAKTILDQARETMKFQKRRGEILTLQEAIERVLSTHRGMIGIRGEIARHDIKKILEEEALPEKIFREKQAEREKDREKSKNFFDRLRLANKRPIQT